MKKCIDCEGEINIPINYYSRCSDCYSKYMLYNYNKDNKRSILEYLNIKL